MAKERIEFTKSDWDKLQQAQRLLHDLLPKMDKAEQCGVECTGYREIHREILERLRNISQHYMPKQPQS